MGVTRSVRAAAAKSGPLDAYVLHAYDWSESSLILDLFTRSHGRLVVVAKGAKRPYSQLRAVLIAFQPIQAHLNHKLIDEADISVLRGAEWTRPGLVSRPAMLLPGFYLNELLIKLVPRRQAHPRLYDVYDWTLRALMLEVDVPAVLRAFELFLLSEHGVLPELHCLTATRAALELEGHYVLDAQLGLRVAPAGVGGVAGAVWLALHQAMAQDDLNQVQSICAVAPSELKLQLRQVLSHHLGNQPLQSRKLLMEFQSA